MEEMTRTAKELGEIARSRRIALGLEQFDVVNRANALMDGAKAISEPTVRAIERGRTNASELKLAILSRALDWPHDALARIREGADPATIADDEPVLTAPGLAFDAAMEKMTPAELRRVRQLANELLGDDK